MHRFKATRKEMRRTAECVIPADYCKLYYLLRFRQSPAYSSGPMGWSCDYYPINHPDNDKAILISTGYRPLAPKGLSVGDAELRVAIKYFNAKAAVSGKKEETEALLKDFVREVVQS